MKPIFRILSSLLIILSIIGFSSCTKKTSDVAGLGKLQLTLSTSEQGQLKSAVTDSTVIPDNDSILASYQVMISVEDMEGGIIFEDKLFPIYKFGSGFVSENIEIPAGQYRLTKFLIIDPSGKVIFAAPVAGSPLAYLVSRPLPIIFTINPDRVTRVLPEVLEVISQPPSEFGYVSFGVTVVKPLTFYTICYLDNPLIMNPVEVSSAAPIVPTEAKLTVIAANGWKYTFRLGAYVNQVIIRGGSEIYTFILEKEGYPTQKMQFTAWQLMSTSKQNPLVLKIPYEYPYMKLFLQPGPDAGKDAMVSNLDPDKNFGDHKYFEATFLTEPVLTVMRSNRSMIWFDMNALPKSATIKRVVLRLTYDVPIPWDSAIYITNSAGTTDPIWCGAVLQQIVEPWDEHKVTWNTQPKTIETNQVYISPFIKNANFIEVDVTSLYLPMDAVSTTARQYGMLFKLWPAERFPGFRFASSDFPVANMRPALTIYYTLP